MKKSSGSLNRTIQNLKPLDYTTVTSRHTSRPASTPKSLFIKQQLIRGMRAKRFTDMLPSENQLAATFGVSRMTARHAVQVVANEGRLRRRRGR